MQLWFVRWGLPLFVFVFVHLYVFVFVFLSPAIARATFGPVVHSYTVSFEGRTICIVIVVFALKLSFQYISKITFACHFDYFQRIQMTSPQNISNCATTGISNLIYLHRRRQRTAVDFWKLVFGLLGSKRQLLWCVPPANQTPNLKVWWKYW